MPARTLSADEMSFKMDDTLSILNPLPARLEGPQLLHKLISGPESSGIALEYSDADGKTTKISYSELHRESDLLAIRLSQLRRQTSHDVPGIIPIYIPQCPSLYISQLAILKSGAAFCPLNLDVPEERLKFILKDTSARFLLTTSTMFSNLPFLEGVNVIVVDDGSPQDDSTLSSRDLLEEDMKRAGPSPLAYIMYTSGSTGLPKAVCLSHLAVTQSLIAHNRFIPSFLRFLQFASPTFDVSVFEIFFPWYRGSTLVSVERGRLLSDLPGTITALDIDAAELTPSVAASLVRTRNSVPTLRTLLTIGEMLNAQVIKQFGGSDHDPGILYGMYGPTEAAIHCTLQPEFAADLPAGTIGIPLETVSCFIVKPAESLERAAEIEILPIGEIGELAVGGHQLADGYLNREEQTRAVFVNHPKFGNLYRTGDKARLLHNGRLECHGRISSGQVKLRGQRVELGEIEHAASKVSGCHAVVASVISGLLVVFCIVDMGSVSPSDIKSACRKWLPNYMVPSDVVLLEDFPYLPSGKVDKKKLESDYTSKSPGSATRESDISEEAKKLTQLVQSVLQTSIDVSTDLGAAGLDSLKAIHVASELRRQGYIGVGALELLEASTVLDVERLLRSRVDKNGTDDTHDQRWQDILKELRENVKKDLGLETLDEIVQDVLPCTPLQDAMLSETARQPQAYCNTLKLLLPAGTTFHQIRSALNALANNHTSLRSGFCTSGIGHSSYAQIIWKSLDVSQVLTVDAWDQSFTIANDTMLLRPLRFQSMETEHGVEVLVHIHHALYDQWSIEIILEDLEALLRQVSIPERPSFTLINQLFSRQRLEDHSTHMDFWQEYLSNVMSGRLPNLSAKTLPPQILQTMEHTIKLDIERFRQTAKSLSCSPHVLCQAVYAILLGFYMGTDDVTFGTVFSGRTLPVPGIEDVVGPILSTLPSRVDLGGARKFSDVVRRLQGDNREIMQHSTVSLADIRRACGVMSGEALFDSIFVWQETAREKPQEPALVKLKEARDYLEFNLTLELEPVDDGIKAKVTHQPNVLPQHQVKILLQQLDELLKFVLAEPDSLMNELSEHISDSCLSIANPEPRFFDYRAGIGSIIEKHAINSPEKLALAFAHHVNEKASSIEALTYKDLNNRANKLAHLLISQGAKPETLICVCMEKSVDLYIAILAAVKAGCGYLPLVPETPSARIKQILVDANVTFCLTDAATTFAITEINKCVAIEVSNLDLSDQPETNPEVPFDPRNIAYAVFTSGTTGQPKGVLVTQENILSNLEVLHRIYPVSDGSRLLQACNQAFDVSVFEIFFTWYTGMCLCAASKDVLFRDFENAINKLEITHLSLTPTVAALANPAHIPKVQFLVTAGEAVTHQVHRSWAGRGLYQGYGPSETTNICTVNPAVEPDHVINNIGPPFENTSAFVLAQGSDFRILPTGGLGELCFGGQQVFRGYRNMPDLTRSKIIEHPKYGRIYRSGDLGRMLPDGTILIQGRTDDQRKIRGQRIELGEITSCLLRVSDVQDCAVEVVKIGEQERLMAFWVPRSRPSETYSILSTDETIRSIIELSFKELADHLPVYMIPDALVAVTAIPMTSQGKIDRRKLVADASNLNTEALNTFSQAFDEKADTSELSELDKRVVSALAETLQLPDASIGRSTSFFALGLDSVSAIRFSTKLREYGYRIDVSQILKSPSIARLASKIEQRSQSPVRDGKKAVSACDAIVRTELRESIVDQFRQHNRAVQQVLPCTPLQEAMLSSGKTTDAPSAYRNKMLFKISGDIANLKRCWKIMVERHEILRTAFSATDSSSLPFVQVVLSDPSLPWNENERVPESVEVLLASDDEKLGSSLDFTPPWQIQIYGSGSRTYLVLDMHHALYDANAMDNLLREVEEVYRDQKLPEPASFASFLDYMVSADLDQADQNFESLLRGFVPKPFNRSISNGSSLGFGIVAGQVPFSSKSVESYLKKHSVTLLGLVQAMWTKALSTSQCYSDVCFGNVVSGRSIPIERVGTLVAPCFNTLPVRIDLSKHRSNLSLIKALQKNNVDTLPYQLTALRRIQRHIALGGQRLFDSLVLLQQESTDLDHNIWSLEGESGEMDFPCIVEFTPENDTYSLSLHFNRSYFDDEAVQKLHQACLSAFASCIRYPSSDISDFDDFNKDIISGLLKPDDQYMQSLETARSTPPRHQDQSKDETWSPLELQIRAAYSAISATPEERIKRDTTIYRIGLDSISAIQVASQLRKKGLALQASDVMESPSCSELASAIQSRSHTPTQSTPAFDFEAFDKRYRHTPLDGHSVSQDEIFAVRPCTAVQSGMLSQYLHSGGQQYFNHTFYTMERQVNVENLKQAWSQVVDQHEMLRTGFTATDDNENPFVMLTYKVFDVGNAWLNNPSGESRDAFLIRKRAASEFVKDKLHLPPWKWDLFEIDGNTCLQFSAHHALFDAESLRMIISDLRSALQGEKPSTRPQIDSTLSLILASSQKDKDGQLAFWSQQLGGAPVTRFPNLTPVRSSDQKAAIVSSVLKHPRSKIETRCQESGVSLQSVGQAAWARILSAYTGETHVTFGVVFSGRTASETSDTPFPCITTLPVFSDTSVGNDELVHALMSYNAGIQKYQFSPLTDIQKYADLPNEALFDSLFAYQRPLTNDVSRPPWNIVHEDASVELAVSIEMEALPEDRLGFRLTIDPAQVPVPQAEIILRQMEELVATLSGISESLDNSTLAIVPPKDPIIPTDFQYLHELAEASVGRCPDRVALEFVDSLDDGKISSRSWTYRQLNEEANKIAHLLIKRGVQPGGVVATSFDKCPEASFAFFGILKAGCAFCAIDPTAPVARKAFILQDSKSRVMLTTASIRTELQSSTECDIIDLINLNQDDPLPTHPVSISGLSPSSISYVLYTSGTTGTPKGCELTHDNVVQALMSFQRIFTGRWTDESRWLQFASFHFDVSVLEQFWSWSVGIRVVGAPRDLVLEDIMGFLDTMQITHLDLTPSLGRLLDPSMVPSLHQGVFITGGEALKQDMINTWGDVGCLFNFYGPTECTIGVTTFPSVPKQGKPSNIGWQFDNVGSYVLSPGSLNPVLRGAVGELCISGKLVGKGYLNREELTEDRFPFLKDFGERVYRTGDLVRLLHDNSFDFLGRQDNQVKLRGQRLEIDEIEAVIRRCPEIQDIVCLVAKHPKQQKDQLIGFIGLSGNRRQGKPDACSPESTKSLIQMARTACEDHLPGYMVPTHFLPIQHIPLSVNNKVEEKILRQLYADMPASTIQAYATHSESQQSLGSGEQKVAQILADLLKIEAADLKPTSNIFTLGLNSISAIQFSRKLKSGGYANAQVATILNSPTIGKLTKTLATTGSQTDGEVADARQTISACRQRHLGTVSRVLRCKADDIEAIAPCTPLQQGIISRSLASESSLYFNTFRFSAQSLDVSRLEKAFNEALERTQMLRTFFIETDDGYVQAVKKSGHLPWWTLEVYDAASMGKVLAKRKDKWRSYNISHLTVPFEIVIVRFESEVVWEVHMHHALYDGNSFDILMDNIVKLYNSQEADFGKSFVDCLPFGPLRNVQGAKDFWLNHLSGVESASMPSLINQEVEQDVLCTTSLKIQAQADQLRRSLGVTIQALIQACWVVTLRKYYHGAIGTVVSGRSIDFDGIEKVIGPLFNTIPFHPRCEAEDSWRTLIQRCHDFNTSALPYQHTPLRDIMKWDKKGRSDPLFDTLFVFQGTLENTSEDTSILTPVEDNRFEADYPLSFEVEESADGNLKVTVAAKSSICDSQKAQELIGEFHEAFSAMAQDPESTIGSCVDYTFNQPKRPVDGVSSNVQTDGSNDFDWSADALKVRSEIAALAGVEEAEINEHTSIFETGLDSVDAVKLSSRLKKKGVNLAVSAIMRSQTIARMVTTLSTTKQDGPRNDTESIHKKLDSSLAGYAQEHIQDYESVERILPASPMQEALVSEMIQSAYKAYFNHDVLNIPVDIEITRLQEAWKTVIEASPILRTGFLEIEDPELEVTFAQVINKPAHFEFEKIELPSVDAVTAHLGEISDIVCSVPLIQPQLRLTLAITSESRYLILSVAHALYDGHSLSLLHQDVKNAYNGSFKSRPFYDQIVQNSLSASNAEAAGFWNDMLSGATKTHLPRASNTQSEDASTHRAEKTSQFSSEDLTAFCKQQGVTFQAACQTAWAFVLAHTVKALDVMFGVVLAGRDSDLAEEVMFPMMNTVVMRSILHGTRKDVLHSIQATIADISNHQHYPLRQIQAACQGQVQRSPNAPQSDPLFDTLFTFQRRPDAQGTESRVLYESVTGASDVEYPIAVEAEIVGTSLVWRVACKSSAFDVQSVHGLLDTIDNVLREIVSKPDDSTLSFQGQAVSVCGLPAFQQPAEVVFDASPQSHDEQTEDADNWSAIELIVREVIAKVTKSPEDEISKTVSIQNLGVDSINAIKISALLRQKSIKISVGDIIRAGSIAKIASVLHDKKQETKRPVDGSAETSIASIIAQKGFTAGQFGYETRAIERILPATAGQVYMLNAWQATSGQIFFPEFEYKTTVATSMDAIEQAWKQLVSANALLRTVFAATEDPALPFVQLVLREAPASFVKLGNGEEPSVDLRQPFSRLSVQETGDGFKLLLKIHHALYDAVSLPLLIESLGGYLQDTAETQQPQVTFADFIAPSLSDASTNARKKFWTAYLRGVNNTQVSSNVSQSARHVEAFDPRAVVATSDLESKLRKQGLTLQALFFAAYARAYSFCAESTAEDVVLGIYLANRSQMEDLSSLAAPTLNLVPLRVRSPVSTPLTDMARQIQEDLQAIGSVENSSVGLWQIEAWTGVKIDTFVNFIKVPGSSDDDATTTQPIVIDEGAEGRRIEKRSRVSDPEGEGFISPQELRHNNMNVYKRSLDIEATVSDGALGIGVFGWEDVIDLEQAEGLIEELKIEIESVLEA